MEEICTLHVPTDEIREFTLSLAKLPLKDIVDMGDIELAAAKYVIKQIYGVEEDNRLTVGKTATPGTYDVTLGDERFDVQINLGIHD